MVTRSKEAFILRLAISRHVDLLRALLTLDEFRYEDLGQRTEKSDAALRTQFSRWQTLGLDLLEKVRAASPEGKGRPVEIFRLNPAWRAVVESALGRIQADTASDSLPVYDTLPQFDEIEELLWSWNDEDEDLSVRFHSTKSAETKFQALRSFLRTTEYKALGFKPATSLLERIEIRIEDAQRACDEVKRLIRHKIPEVQMGSDNFRKDLQSGQLSGYFHKMPARSVSGFGGALLARALGADCAGLDDFLARQFARRESDGARIKYGFSHVLGEIVELVNIDVGWEPPTGRIIDGAAFCPAVAELQAFPDSMKCYHSHLIQRHTEPDPSSASGALADTATNEEDWLSKSILAAGVAQTPRGKLHDMFNFGNLLGGFDGVGLHPVAG